MTGRHLSHAGARGERGQSHTGRHRQDPAGRMDRPLVLPATSPGGDRQSRLWRRGGNVNDEALELQQRLPDVPHVQNPDRVHAAKQAIDELGCEVVVLDDAFQHRRLVRDLDIVLLDALEPFGFGHVFPRGTLREPVMGLGRTGRGHVAEASFCRRTSGIAFESRSDACRPMPFGWKRPMRRRRSVRPTEASRRLIRSKENRWQPSAALAIRPGSATLSNPVVIRWPAGRVPDHHHYSPADVEAIAAWARQLHAGYRLHLQGPGQAERRPRCGTMPLWAVSIGLEFLAGQAEFERRLQAIGAGRRTVDHTGGT